MGRKIMLIFEPPPESFEEILDTFLDRKLINSTVNLHFRNYDKNEEMFNHFKCYGDVTAVKFEDYLFAPIYEKENRNV